MSAGIVALDEVSHPSDGVGPGVGLDGRIINGRGLLLIGGKFLNSSQHQNFKKFAAGIAGAAD